MPQGLKLVAHLLTEVEQVVTLGQTLLSGIVDRRWRFPGSSCKIMANWASVWASIALVFARLSSALAK